MTSTAQTEAPAQAPEVHVEAVFERLPVDPWIACDGHASHAVQALVQMLTGKGSIVNLCGHHARIAGWDHVARVNQIEQDNRAKGSDH